MVSNRASAAHGTTPVLVLVMSIPTVQYRFSFGLKGDVSGNVCYLDEQSIIYPAGTNLVLFNIDQKTQRFMGFGTGGDGATALAVSPNKRYAAVAEKKDKPAITIFDLQTMRKRKVLSCPDLGSHEFVWLGFSPDSKFFIGQGGGPDWVLVYWHWEKAKIMATAKVSAPANHPVHQVSSLVTIQSCELHLVFLYRCPSTLRTTLKCVLSVKSCSNYFATVRGISSSLLSPKPILRTTCVTHGSLKISY